jgi:hypothetical protein
MGIKQRTGKHTNTRPVSNIKRQNEQANLVQRTLGSMFEGYGAANHNGNPALVTAGFHNW